jgi:alpha-aminoadipic semialdehyde synthase
MQSFKDIGLLEDTRKIQIDSWASFLARVLTLKLGSSSGLDGGRGSLEKVVSGMLHGGGGGGMRLEEMMSALEWLGLLPGSSGGRGKAVVPMTEYTPLELFAMVLGNKLRYGPMERDMVVLSHEVIVRNGQQQQEEAYRSTLVAYGDESASAMAKTVGLPVAFAALDVLDGKIGMRGVCGPNEKEIYKSVLGKLEEVGLGMVESVDLVGSGGVMTVEESLRGSREKGV